jgi:cytochrome c-type biogenesis protein CcmF
MAPLAILLMIVVGMCPLLAWRRADTAHLKRNFKAPVLVGSITLIVLLGVSRARHPGVVVAIALAAFVLTTVVAEIRRGLHARRTIHGESLGRAVHHLFAFTPRRYGGPIVHAGIVILITGIAVNVAFKQSYESTMKVGTSSKAGASMVTFTDLRFEQDTTKFALIGTFDVTDPSGNVHTIVAKQVEFSDQQNVTEVGIDAGLGGDLYLVMNNADPGRQVATIQYYVEPGVFWIWLGMVIVVLGGVLAAWPWRPKVTPVEPEDQEGDDDEPELVGVGSEEANA